MSPPPARGRLLVAAPGLLDPNFFRTVVLLLAHGSEGSLGLVLNRPAPIDLPEVLPRWAEQAADPASLFLGGPVEPEAAICLAWLRPGPQPRGWLQVNGWAGLLDLDAADELRGRIARLRVFAGYAGWGPGQLATEVAAGAWYVVECEPSDPFSSRPEQLWRRVLRRQGGELAVVANCPRDPGLN